MLLRSLDSKDPECLRVATRYLDEQRADPASTRYFSRAWRCAKDAKNTEDSKRFLSSGLTAMEDLFAKHRASMSPDEQSTLLREIRYYAESLELPKKAMAWARVQREILDRAARSAQSAFFASAYNWHRAEVYAYLGEGAALTPELKASEAALSDNDDPPSRLAWLYHRLGRHESALAAAQRSKAKAKGPRIQRIDGLIQKNRGSARL